MGTRDKAAQRPAGVPATDRRRRWVIVANRTGGQGKTLLSQLLFNAFAKAGRPLLPMSADSVSTDPGAAGAGTGVAAPQSKLGKALPGTVELGIGRSLLAGGGVADLLTYWEPLGELVLAADTLLDTGANIVDPILDWLVSSDAYEELVPDLVVDLVVPVTCNSQPLADAEAMVAAVLASGAMPLRNVYVVQNQWGLPEASIEDVQGVVTRLRALAASQPRGRRIEGGIALLHLKACDTTTGSKALAELDRDFCHLGLLDAQVNGREYEAPRLADAVLSAEDRRAGVGLADRERQIAVLGGKGGIPLEARQKALDDKVEEARKRVAGYFASATVFVRNRERSRLKAWFAEFDEMVRASGLVEGTPLALAPDGGDRFVDYVTRTPAAPGTFEDLEPGAGHQLGPAA